MTLSETTFFENVNHQLNIERYDLLLYNLTKIDLDTFFDIVDESYIEKIHKVFQKINSVLQKSNFNSDLLSFYWTLADQIYHGENFDQFDNELSEAKRILKGNDFQSEEKDLLLQKIEQHYSL
ncbi:hypothetical protein [Flavobacterium aquicola]|uniref:Uncharacterized protein n=1 Tax=Flavobacterium aquicola TaxID=1682742 RepID=A0A3E0DVY9_9FLAO|nr:hypothetical protein [Flavobacterium aquicola]REG90244.1 hypothetical protein C8P67_1274 [Flavobacterium aquicola]